MLLFLDSGYFNPESLMSAKGAGGVFESLVYLHLKALSQLLTPRPAIFYWRRTTGKEVDFVISLGQKLIAIEVKLTDKPKYADIQNLRLFMQEYPETKAGVLIHT